ncbi:MAG: hypothetical protein LBQ46_07625 [Treponema sp.]|jgi:hypothetical protein|nr:hypothetical protein [Treponema sp.]
MAERKKRVLVIIDDADSSYDTARRISAALKDCRVTMRRAVPAGKGGPEDRSRSASGRPGPGSVAAFAGNDILGADVFFLGCEKPRSPSFAYVERLLAHINLAGRSCGFFSTGSLTVLKYLNGLLKSCEAIRGDSFQVTQGKARALKTWARGVAALKR